MPLLLDAPNLGEREKEMLLQCVDSTYVSTAGPFVPEFEERFARYLGAPAAVAVQSGTAAIHIALLELGIGAGDEVIVPALQEALRERGVPTRRGASSRRCIPTPICGSTLPSPARTPNESTNRASTSPPRPRTTRRLCNALRRSCEGCYYNGNTTEVQLFIRKETNIFRRRGERKT